MNVSLFLHPKSTHTFSIHQHIILLVLRQYESKLWEFCWMAKCCNSDCNPITAKITFPFYHTAKGSCSNQWKNVNVAIGRFIGTISSSSIFVEININRILNKTCSPYYTYRCNIRHAFTKIPVGSDMKSQLICAVLIQHYPVSQNIRHFSKSFSQMLHISAMWIMVLDKRYDV